MKLSDQTIAKIVVIIATILSTSLILSNEKKQNFFFFFSISEVNITILLFFIHIVLFIEYLSTIANSEISHTLGPVRIDFLGNIELYLLAI